MKLRFFMLVLGLLALSPCASAHEMRPAYLELQETNPGEFSVLWKTPMVGDARLALTPEFSGEAKATTPVVMNRLRGASVQTWTLRSPQLRGQTVSIRGLEGTLTDTLVRFAFTDGSEWTQRLTPQNPSALIPPSTSLWNTAWVYLKLGVVHILSGIDHLLFVLALLIITSGGWKLVKTVTAFTVSHSITLTAVTLGLIHVPQRPVEAVIALSIVFVATEIVQRSRGRIGIAARAPWIVAFTFGLLHGVGFASGLSEAGLPAGRIQFALLCFSGGVETGHLLFVVVALSVIALGRLIPIRLPLWAPLVPPYAIGCVAMFWVFQRIAAF